MRHQRKWGGREGGKEKRRTERKVMTAYTEFQVIISKEVSVNCSVVPDSLRPPGLQPTRLLCP